MHITLDFWAVLAEWPLLLKGILGTVELTLAGVVIGMFVAILCAWARTSGPAWLTLIIGTYVEIIRNTPFIVQLFFLFFGLPSIGVDLSPEAASIIAIVLNLAAYCTEIIRAGIEATPKGQIEAASSLALNRTQIYLHVVLPPALKRVWPSMVSQIIIVMLGTSVCNQISVNELSYAANYIQSNNFRSFESFIIATLIYLFLSVVLRRVLNWIGPKFIFGK